VLVERIEQGLELDRSHLGEHPEVFDLTASALGDDCGVIDTNLRGHLAFSMMSRSWDPAVNSKSRARLHGFIDQGVHELLGRVETDTARSVACPIGSARTSSSSAPSRRQPPRT
jgi:hypothetical protein